MKSPVIARGAAANLITNAQVTGARVGRTLRRPRRQVLTTVRRLASDGEAVLLGPLRAARVLAGNCEAPIRVSEVGGTYARPILDTVVRCRKCTACLRQRSAVWSARAKAEIEATPRTWLVTLTATPAVHYRWLLQACQNSTRKGVDPAEWRSGEEFARRWSEFGKETTKWLKRIRSTGARFTYLQVVEAHKSGLPHVHLLIHDLDGVTYRRLVESWPHGFAHAKLVTDARAARYVSKYLAKSALARVRASQAYGQQVTPSRQSDVSSREKF